MGSLQPRLSLVAAPALVRSLGIAIVGRIVIGRVRGPGLSPGYPVVKSQA